MKGQIIKTRIYGLDLARCLAVSMVVIIHSIQQIFHVAIPYFWYLPMGGVELFFSLSGFLIGRILLDIFSSPDLKIISLLRFWTNRWLRTLPLYFITYFVYLIFYNLLIHPVNFDLRYLIFLQNVNSTATFFGESWSLSIEEWFYFLVPLLIFIFYLLAATLSANLKRETLFLITAVTMVVGMIVFRQISVSSGINDQATIYRIDAIAYALLAAYVSTQKKQLSNLKSVYVIVAGLTIWAIAAIIKMEPSRVISPDIKTVYYPLSGIGTSVFVIGLYYYDFSKKCAFVSRTSRISYSIYLIHLSGVLYPLSVLTKSVNFLWLTVIWATALVAIFILSSWSYRFIERPFIKLRLKLFQNSI